MPQEMVSSLSLTHIARPGENSISTTLFNLDKEMGQLLARTDVPLDEKAKQYAQILRRYLVFRQKRKNIREAPVPVKVLRHENYPEKEASVKEETNNESKSDTEESSVLKNVMDITSESKKSQVERFLRYLTDKDSLIKWNKRGEVEIEGKTIPGSHLADLVLDFTQPRKGFEPIGWQPFAQTLSRMNIPKSLISNTQRRNFMQTEYSFNPDMGQKSSLPDNEQLTPKNVTKRRKSRTSKSSWSPYPRRVTSLSSKH